MCVHSRNSSFQSRIGDIITMNVVKFFNFLRSLKEVFLVMSLGKQNAPFCLKTKELRIWAEDSMSKDTNKRVTFIHSQS